MISDGGGGGGDDDDYKKIHFKKEIILKTIEPGYCLL